MYQATVFEPGGYRYLPAVFQYSAGVAAEPGYVLEQARFLKPLPLAQAYRAIEQHLKSIGRPSTAFAHCELRTPSQFDDQGFIDFNREYVKTLESWGVYLPGNGSQPAAINPVARTNVCPEYDKPADMVMFSFAYTVPTTSSIRSFVVSGGGEARKGSGPYSERIVAYGETSPAALRAKLEFVANEMTDRIHGLGFTWANVTTAQAYSVRDMGQFYDEVLARPGRVPGGLNWFFARPPVTGLEIEMDCRGAVRQIFI